MNKQTTKAIVLKRINYGDSDRIITLLTPQMGKLSLLAKGVRKINSKLAGSIELFTVFDAGFVIGNSSLGRLTSARIDEFYDNIIHDISRVQLGYEILKTIDKITEDNPESSYFYLLCQLLRLLNNPKVSLAIIDLYFKSKLLTIGGHAPNLLTDAMNNRLDETLVYDFNLSSMSLMPTQSGRYKSSHIKLMRLLFNQHVSQRVFNVKLGNHEDEDLKPDIDAMFKAYL